MNGAPRRRGHRTANPGSKRQKGTYVSRRGAGFEGFGGGERGAQSHCATGDWWAVAGGWWPCLRTTSRSAPGPGRSVQGSGVTPGFAGSAGVGAFSPPSCIQCIHCSLSLLRSPVSRFLFYRACGRSGAVRVCSESPLYLSRGDRVRDQDAAYRNLNTYRLVARGPRQRRASTTSMGCEFDAYGMLSTPCYLRESLS